VFTILVAALIAARVFLIPDTFGEFGHYRGAAIDDVTAQPIKYAGRASCETCHPDVVEKHAGGRHHGVSCEVCHGPAAAHVEDPMAVVPDKPRGRDLCVLCHAYDPGRPTGFPQIDPAVHNPLRACMACHEGHAPKPPVTPEGCSGCHGQIARAKAVSHHALLPCTTCHEVSEQHKLAPASSRPTKPTAREFCGKCHAPDATPPAFIIQEVPRKDLSTHGDHYVCWQCHYPHFPELK